MATPKASRLVNGIDRPTKVPERAKTAGYPGFIEPALATLRSNPPPGANWLHEIKFDGYRLQAHIRSGRVWLMTRSGLDWRAKFGNTLTAALGALSVRDAIIDGEVVVEGAGGSPDFSPLEDALATGSTDRLVFYAFGLLYLDGYDLRSAPFIERKAAFREIIAAPGIVRYSEHFQEHGDLVLRHACRLGLEGVVSKLRDAPYRSGRGARSGGPRRPSRDGRRECKQSLAGVARRGNWCFAQTHAMVDMKPAGG